jgi:hypothetical protein
MMIKSILRWLLLLTLISYGGVQAKPASPNDMACPIIKDVGSSSKTGKVDRMPGSANLSQGIVRLDQGRYAAAYTAFEAAIDQGIPDSIERAAVYQQMGLLMCRLNSPELCQRNLELAFMVQGVFDLPAATFRLPYVQKIYQQARWYFESRCAAKVPSAQAQMGTMEAVTNPPIANEESSHVSLTKVNTKDSRKYKPHNYETTASLLLRVKPWATVAIDNSEVVTPPVKTLKIKPGVRMLSIKHPNFKPILIEANFKKGETWVVQQTY